MRMEPIFYCLIAQHDRNTSARNQCYVKVASLGANFHLHDAFRFLKFAQKLLEN